MPKAKGVAPSEERLRRKRMMPSKTQTMLMNYVREFRRRTGYPTSRAEIARELGMTEANIDHHLSQLTLKGWARVEPHVQRSIVLLREGVPLIDAATGEGLDESDPDRPRIDGLEAVFGETPELFVRVGNDAMAGAGVRRGDLVAITQSREPKHGELVAAQIGDAIEMRRFERTHGVDMLETEPEKWGSGKSWQIRADADNVTMLGVEIASMTTAEGRKRHEREMVRARKRAERGLEV